MPRYLFLFGVPGADEEAVGSRGNLTEWRSQKRSEDLGGRVRRLVVKKSTVDYLERVPSQNYCLKGRFWGGQKYARRRFWQN